MKNIVILVVILWCSSFAQASDIADSFTQKYSALVPRENSSVQSDYLFEQIALGSQYTIMMLEKLNTNNDSLNERVDVMIEKFDILIEQNKKMIELLEKKVKKISE
jgi:hypothetical protein